MAWLGPGLLPARAVSAAASVLTAALLGLAARRASRSTLAGCLAAGFFLASPYVFHTTPLARVNGTALLAAVIGLSFVERPTRTRVLLGSLALVLALFAKPTVLDAVVAAVLSLLLRNWRLGLLSIACISGVSLAGLAAMMIWTRGAFWLNVVAGNANPFDPWQLWTYVSNFSVLHCVLLALAAVEAIRAIRRQRWSPWVLYLVTSGIATLGVGKWGAGESYYLPLIAATSVLAAIWVARSLEGARRLGQPHMQVALGLALFIQGLLMSHAAVSAALPWLPDRGPQSNLLGRAPTWEDQVSAESVAEQIRARPGPVLSEDPSFGVVAGRGVVGNATHLRNLYQAGLWDPTPMVNDLQARRYAIVVLNAELYPEPVLAAIGKSYYLYRTVHVNGATYRLFLPGSD
jgi:hypothetical protein